MRRLLVFTCLAFAACSVSNDLESLKGTAGAGGQAGQAGADAAVEAGQCLRNVDCKGCVACEDFCNCAAPLSAVDICIQGCNDGGSSGDSSTGGARGATSRNESSGATSGASTGGASSGGSGGTGGIAYVSCGVMACAGNNICCATSKATYNCVQPSACTDVPVLCEGPSTCAKGEDCCVRFSGSAVSEVICAGGCSKADKVACAEDPKLCGTGDSCVPSNIGIVKYCN